jgi:hypothetical protein
METEPLLYCGGNAKRHSSQGLFDWHYLTKTTWLFAIGILFLGIYSEDTSSPNQNNPQHKVTTVTTGVPAI